MSVLRAIAGFLGLHERPVAVQRHLALVDEAYDAVAAAEVDSERQRYSAARYVEMMRAAYLHGEDAVPAEHRAEFMRYVHGLSPDEYASFFGEVDDLVDKGKLWTVLTPEEAEEARQRVLARVDEIRADAALPMHNSLYSIGAAMNPALRNALSNDAALMPTDDAVLGLPSLPSFPELGDDDGEEEDQDEDEGQGLLNE